MIPEEYAKLYVKISAFSKGEKKMAIKKNWRTRCRR